MRDSRCRRTSTYGWIGVCTSRIVDNALGVTGSAASTCTTATRWLLQSQCRSPTTTYERSGSFHPNTQWHRCKMVTSHFHSWRWWYAVLIGFACCAYTMRRISRGRWYRSGTYSHKVSCSLQGLKNIWYIVVGGSWLIDLACGSFAASIGSCGKHWMDVKGKITWNNHHVRSRLEPWNCSTAFMRHHLPVTISSNTQSAYWRAYKVKGWDACIAKVIYEKVS